MTNPGSSPEPPKKGFKVTLMQGVIGAVSLAGTTAIPLVVQRVLGPTTPASSPTPVPSQVSSPTPQVQPSFSDKDDNASLEDDDHQHNEKGKGKGKGKKNH